MTAAESVNEEAVEAATEAIKLACDACELGNGGPDNYNDWIVTSADGVRIMPRAEVLAQFQPLDWDEAYDMLGSTDWPGRPSNPADDSPSEQR